MTGQQGLVVSADGHILEPTDLFITRLPKHLRDRGVWEEDFEIEPLVEGGARVFRRLHTPGFEGWTISRYRQTGGRTPTRAVTAPVTRASRTTSASSTWRSMACRVGACSSISRTISVTTRRR